MSKFDSHEEPSCYFRMLICCSRDFEPSTVEEPPRPEASVSVDVLQESNAPTRKNESESSLSRGFPILRNSDSSMMVEEPDDPPCEQNQEPGWLPESEPKPISESEVLADEFFKKLAECYSVGADSCVKESSVYLREKLGLEVFWLLIATITRGDFQETDEPQKKDRSKRQSSKKDHKFYFDHKLCRQISFSLKPPLPIQKSCAGIPALSLSSRKFENSHKLPKEVIEGRARVKTLTKLAKKLFGAKETLRLEEDLLTKRPELDGEPQPPRPEHSVKKLLSTLESLKRTYSDRIDTLLTLAETRRGNLFSENFNRLVSWARTCHTGFAHVAEAREKHFSQVFEFQLERSHFEELEANDRRGAGGSNAKFTKLQHFKPVKDHCQVCNSDTSYDDNKLVFCSVRSLGVQHSRPPALLRDGPDSGR